jgi:hypothetical protein
MFKVAVGHSNDPDSLEAIREVLGQCQHSLAGLTPQAGVLFTTIDFEHGLILKQIEQAYPGLELIGGTSDGEVSSVLEFQQDSLTLMLFCSDEVEFKAAVGRNISQDPLGITQAAVATAKARLSEPPQLCIAIPESLTANISRILEGLAQALGNVPIFGGAAADNFDVKRTYQFFKTEVLSDAVPILLLSGKLHFSSGISSGWQPMGKPSRVTKSTDNVIHEIDGKPALEFYQYYFEEFKPDVAYPLAICPPGEDQFYLRGALSHDPESGSITVGGDVPVDSTVQITDSSLEDIIAASQAAFASALADYPGEEPAAALFFSCAWRRLVMGSRTSEEYRSVTEKLEQPLPSCGFYTFGELAPLHNKGKTYLHNTTFVTLLLGSP